MLISFQFSFLPIWSSTLCGQRTLILKAGLRSALCMKGWDLDFLCQDIALEFWFFRLVAYQNILGFLTRNCCLSVCPELGDINTLIDDPLPQTGWLHWTPTTCPVFPKFSFWLPDFSFTLIFKSIEKWTHVPLEVDSCIFIISFGFTPSPIKTGSHLGHFPQPCSQFLISCQHLPILPHKYC